ncbi:uncharacterized protein [Choristoneura fumiferana]|uniref:uncharacterized protein n=1 Tax=Choristoneura fumiferana TaxID=7141 RepID=UPI003D15CF6C
MGEKVQKVIQGLQLPVGQGVCDAESWNRFRQSFEIYLTAAGLEDEKEERKIAIFLSCVGDDVLDVYNGLEKIKSWKELETKLDEHFGTKTNTVINSYKFFNMRQQPDESVEHFVAKLKIAAKLCKFEDEKRLVRDMIVIGICDMSVKERLLRETDLDLENAIKICKAAEESRKQVKEFEANEKEHVSFIKQGRSKENRKTSKVIKCDKCGKEHELRSCPAFGRKCLLCSRYNHFAVMCRLKNRMETKATGKENYKKRINVVQQNDSDSSSEDYVVDTANKCSQY